MDADRFDALTRTVVAAASRRSLVRAAVAAVAGAWALARVWPVGAVDCQAGTYRCGSGDFATCCPFGQDCCHLTGECCDPGELCFRGVAGDVCKPKCGENERRCAAGEGECCPYGQVCCGTGFRICCGPGEECLRPDDGGPPRCLASCPLGQFRCGTTGECCPFGQDCCGVGNRTCCAPGKSCHRVGAVSRCLPRCGPLAQRCRFGSCCRLDWRCCRSNCCPPNRRCCAGDCCPPGEVCVRIDGKRRCAPETEARRPA